MNIERNECHMPKREPRLLRSSMEYLEQMGHQIKLARLRRKLPVELVAERARVSRTTIWNIEKGSPSVSIGAYAAVMHALGGMDKDLTLVCKDDVLGRTMQDLELPIRQRAPKQKEEDLW